MSLQKFCDACNGELGDYRKNIRAAVKSPSGKHLATVVLNMFTATGAEHVCAKCRFEALRREVAL